MSRKKKSEHDIPESVCLFNNQEIEYIHQCAKSIPYRIDIQTACINVPPDHFDIASEHLHVRHLINKFAFVVQATIGAEYMPGKEFNPVMKERQEPEQSSEVVLPKRGEVWLFGAERWYFKQVTDKQYGITFLESLKIDITVNPDFIRQKIERGELVKEDL